VNGFANAYIQTNLQLKVEPSQKAASFLGEQTKALRANLETAQAKISKYQQEKGLTNIVGSLDVESARLNDLSSQLVMAQSQAYESNSRQRSAGGNGLASPDVTANSVIQNMKVEIARVESKLSELSQRVGVNHPQYQATKEELEKLKSMLRQETQNVSSSIAGTANIYRQREAELKAALAAQKARVLELNLSRDELAVLQRDVENAQRAMDAASQRYTQATLEGKANQSDVAVLNPATAPQTQSSPKVMLNILLSVFLGTMLGVFFALLVELMNRRVRSRDDLSELLEVPVFTISGGSAQSSSKNLIAPPRLLLKAK
jgi:chain length determinant protein EpsF